MASFSRACKFIMNKMVGDIIYVHIILTKSKTIQDDVSNGWWWNPSELLGSIVNVSCVL